MRLYDATLPLREGMIVYPGDPDFEITPVCDRAKGDPFNLALLSMGTHTGTHVDSPAHYIEGGAGVDAIPLDALLGPGAVLDMRGRPCIDEQALVECGAGVHKRILFRTDSGSLLSSASFKEDHVHLTENGARYLVKKGVRLVGIDYPSIERPSDGGSPVHRILLEAGIVIVESAHLLGVPPGPYEILCLPLPVKGGDGAPARLILRREEKEEEEGSDGR